jgi:hypothetical protein
MLYQGDWLVGVEMFEPEDFDLALARFEELRPDPLRIPPNAATRVRDRTLQAFEARDWQTLRSLASDAFVFDDRTKRAVVSGGVELWINSVEYIRAMPRVQLARELIATVGDRIAIERIAWTGGPEGGDIEAEAIRLSEIDADGRLSALISFDVEDRGAAFAEAQARFVAGEAAACGGQAPIVVMMRSFAGHDWETLGACLADDLVFGDHRGLALLGALRRDEWVESMRVQADLAPDSDVETIRIFAWNGHGRAEMSRVFGTLRDGGPFENVLLRVMVTNGDLIQHFDVYDVGDTDRALARFAELCEECA